MNSKFDRLPEFYEKYAAACEEIAVNVDASIDSIAVKNDLTIYYLNKYAKEDERCAEMLTNAHQRRASRYVDKARLVAESIPDFYPSESPQMFRWRERSQAVNKAKVQVENLWRYAAALAPEIYGDKSHFIKDLEKQIKEIQKQLSEKETKL